MAPRFKYINELINSEGSIAIDNNNHMRFASATDGYSCLAMLRVWPEETVLAVLSRLDKAVKLAVEKGTYTDEVN